MCRLDLLLVNAPADLGKKPFDLAFPFQRRLNFGLLSLATVAKRAGVSVEMVDPQISPERSGSECLEAVVRDRTPRVAGISCISGFSYPTALDFARTIRRACPDCAVIIGGKDHVGQLGTVPLEECDALDVVVRGEGETVLLPLLRALSSGASLETIPNLVVRDADGRAHATCFDPAAARGEPVELDYELLPHSRGFAPSVEVSRGCSFGCEFCVSARTTVRRISPSAIVESIAGLVRHYGDEELKLYFESPMFLMRDDEIHELVRERTRRTMTFTWRTETRVDYLDSKRLRSLYEAGLRVVDLGFESGCPEILARMKKTGRPDEYLRRAREILRTAYDLGIIVKLNVLFYVGETPSTVARTVGFLEDCLPWVESVSAYPLMLYPGAQLELGLASELRRFGGRFVDAPEWRARHLTPIDLSDTLSYSQASDLGTTFARSFQTLDVFFRQKQYGYFSPGVTRQQFTQAAIEFGLERLPFSRDVGAAATSREGLRKRLMPIEAPSVT